MDDGEVFASKEDIQKNLEDMVDYQDLRMFLVNKIARLRKTSTQRRTMELTNLVKLQTILDLSAIVATGDTGVVDALYFHLS